MPSDKFEMFRNRLSKMWKHYRKLAQRQGITCFRFYDHDLPEFPFVLEKFADVVHGAEYQRKHGMEVEEHAIWLQNCRQIIAEVLDIEVSSIYLKERKRIIGRQTQYTKTLEQERQEKIVEEHGLHFIVNLTDYLDTGLFLDHRITRQLFRSQAAGKKVLNLFCYTGAFSVYAADGNALSVTSVDMSNTYLNWAKRNLQYNKLFKPDQHVFIQSDVMQWLRDDPTEGYELVICDPPTFSNSKRMLQNFDVQQHHVLLINSILSKMKAGAKLYFSNNYRNFQLDQLAIQATHINNITAATTPFDFQGRLHRVCFELIK